MTNNFYEHEKAESSSGTGEPISGVKFAIANRVPSTLTRQLTSEAVERSQTIA